MLNIKPTISDIDVSIQAMQKDLFYILCDKWGITAKDYESYGRCYRNQSKGSDYIPEVYTQSGNYKEVLGSDKIKFQSFFGVGQNVRVNNYKSVTADVHLICMANLEKIKCDEGDKVRKDVEVRNDVYDVLKMGLYGFEVEGGAIITGIENVFAEYAGSRRDSMKHRDMHPYHYFRFNMTCTYDPNTTTKEIDYETNNLINS